MCRPSSFVTCNLATIYIRWKEKKKKGEGKKKKERKMMDITDELISWVSSEKKKKKKILRILQFESLAMSGKTFCRGVVIMETYGRLDARGNIYDGNSNWFEREYCKNVLKIFGRHLTRLCAWSRTKMIDHCNGRKNVLQGSPLLWKVMVYRCEWGNDWNIIWERF